jgi:hypothetical protein
MSLQIEQIKEVNKVNEVNEVNEVNKVNGVNEVNKVNEDNEDNDCGICGSQLIEDIVKLKCNHKYHFECLYLSYKFSHSNSCPYCRTPCKIPTSKKDIKQLGGCEGILKYGKRKGELCNCNIFKNSLGLKLCKRHFNMEQKKLSDNNKTN